MDITTAIIGGVVGAGIVLAILLFMRRGSGDMIEAIKLVREATGMGLKEAKDLVEMAARV